MMPSRKNYYQRKYLDDGSLNPKWKPRTSPRSYKKKNTVEENHNNLSISKNGEHKSNTKALRKNRYQRFITWLESAPSHRLSNCPFCHQERKLEPMPNSSSLVRVLNHKFPFWMYYQQNEAPCVDGFIYDSEKVIPVIGNETSDWVRAGNYIPFTSSMELSQEGILCRPSCDLCNTSNKLYVQLRRIRLLISSHNATERRKERMHKAIREPIDRNEIYLRDNGICHVCNNSVDKENFHLDHVIPISKGGSHTADNIKIAHPKCNLKKYDKV